MKTLKLLALVLSGCAAGSEGYQDPSSDVALARTELLNECDVGTAVCDPHAACIDTAKGYDCKCGAGFFGDGRTCTDVDECAQATAECPAETRCENIPGGYACAPLPLEQDPQAPDCRTACGENSRCVEVDGGAACACLNGYEFDGAACVPSISVALDGGAGIVRTDGAQALVLPPRNLLQNPSFETGSADGWTLQGRADGWKVVSPGVFGDHGLASGSTRVAAEQIVDLRAAGITEASLDGELPPRIYALVVYKMQGPDLGDFGNLYVDLLDAGMVPVVSWHDNLAYIYRDTHVSSREWWDNAYPPGVRYVRLRVEAWDAERALDDHRGIILDGAAVTVGDPAQIRWTNDGETWTDWFRYQPMIGSGIGFSFDGERERTLMVEAMTSDGDVFAGSDSIRLE